MKKIILSVSGIVLSFILFTVSICCATPLYYTFEGTITEVHDSVGYIGGYGLNNGSSVSYTLLIDFEAKGIFTRYDGSTHDYDSWSHDWDFFYTDYISGSALPSREEGAYLNVIEEYNYGSIRIVDDINNGINYIDYSTLTVNSGANPLTISSLVNFNLWNIGSYVEGKNSVFGSFEGEPTVSVLSALILTNISNTYNIVPEPTTMLLLGFGLLGVAGVSRKKFF